MQGIGRATRSCQETLKLAILQHCHGRSTAGRKNVFSRHECVTTSNPTMEQKGLENTTVAEVLMTKGEEKSGSWLWCRTNDTVYDAAKHMAENNIGSLVVLKPGEPKHIAGIFTERDYMRKIIAHGRSSKDTKVGEIMTDELLTEYQIRHVPVIDGKIVGMISIVDIVRAVVELQSGEVKRLNEFIKGDYY
eukprot:XP_019072263.1 PREDICTED: CBS domain-containing protein CBSX3, mitochondrial isoform X3 [Vitis vinifera]